ncbi:MAG TPA: nodulation protein NfeD [Chthoniobacterales bacterium]|jgi:membrane-bound serine protease (ClpP class)|nr:nodulation protein NfeD [Chthoniobacterales bacterium]
MRSAGLLVACWLCALTTMASGARVCLSKVDGAIGPATASYISRSVDEAQSKGVQCLIIQLNTPGGLLDSTRVIVQKLLGSPIPVVVYVAPTGASAASAGCFITLAANVAAMAPATTIGAAHPVSLGGLPSGDQSKPDQTMTQKLENFAVSYMEAIASRRNRNIEWAKSAVRESASITAEKALELKVVEIVARDLDDLLGQLNGRLVNGKPLDTAAAQIVEIKVSVTEQLLQMFWRPEVMFVLMLVAIYGLIGEMTTPGAILPGVVGAIALILALYMAAILPVNIAGLLLIGLAIALFLIDVFAPTHGVLTGGGILAFLVGSLMLFDRRDPLFRLSLSYIIPSVVLTAGFFLLIVGKALQAQRLPVKVGKETMLGKHVQVITPIDASGGRVFVEGEYWTARSDQPIKQGETVRIMAVEGLTVKVVPKT